MVDSKLNLRSVSTHLSCCMYIIFNQSICPVKSAWRSFAYPPAWWRAPP